MKTHLDIESLTAERAWLSRLAYRMVHDKDEADDVVQETLTAALRSPPAADRSARGWLGHVATNVVRGRYRSSTRRSRREQAVHEQTEPVASDAFAQLHVQQSAARLAKAVDQLVEPFRTAVHLRFYDDLSIAEIAVRQGVPVGTAGWRVHEGLKRLRASLDRDAGGDARQWLMALCPLGPSVPTEATVPTSGMSPAPGNAAAPKGSKMSKWIGWTVAAALTATGVTVAASQRDDAPKLVEPPPEGAAPQPSSVSTTAGPSAPSRTAPTPGARPPGRVASASAGKPPSDFPEASEVTFVVVEGPGSTRDTGSIPGAMTRDLNEYGSVMFECFDAYGERANTAEAGDATVRVTIVQDPQLGPIVTDSQLLADRSMPADDEFRECFRSGGLAIKFDEAIGAPGDRYVIDIRATTDAGRDAAAARACFDDLVRHKGMTVKDRSFSKIDDPIFIECIEKTLPELGAPSR